MAVTIALLSGACATGRAAKHVEVEIAARTGHETDFARRPEDAPELPPGIDIDDGFSDEEAAAIALWNSPALRADLSRLHAAEADVIAAKRPPNPTLRALVPLGPVQFSLLVTWPLEAFVTMPRRKKIAKANERAVADSVVQTSLDLTRDARLAHADWALAVDRQKVRRELATQQGDLAAIAEARAALGDVPQRDADAARADARAAEDEAARAEDDELIARTRLAALVGHPVPPSLRPSADDPLLSSPVPRADDLETMALTARPDLRSARLSIEAAGARVGLQKWAVLSVAGVGSAQAGGGANTGFSLGPEVVLPIFDQNQGGIARARAELEAATWRYHDLRQRIVGEVAEADAQLRQATRSLATYRDTIVAARKRELEAATAEYEIGDQPYVVVLIAGQQLQTASLRAVELAADARRARAQLERALGRRLAPSATPSTRSSKEAGP